MKTAIAPFIYLQHIPKINEDTNMIAMLEKRPGRKTGHFIVTAKVDGLVHHFLMSGRTSRFTGKWEVVVWPADREGLILTSTPVIGAVGMTYDEAMREISTYIRCGTPTCRVEEDHQALGVSKLDKWDTFWNSNLRGG